MRRSFSFYYEGAKSRPVAVEFYSRLELYVPFSALRLSKFWSFVFSFASILSARPVFAAEWSPFQAELRQSSRLYSQKIYGFDNWASTTDAEFTTGLTDDSFGAKFVPWIRIQTPSSVAGDQRDLQTFPEGKEAWVEWHRDDWDFRIGNQLLVWGSGDFFNPTDVWNPTDFTDPLEPARLPLALAKLSVHPLAMEHFILDLVVTPQFRPNRLPILLSDDPTSIETFDPSDSRWLIPTPSLAQIRQADFIPLTYHVTGTQSPRDWQGGARLRVVRMGHWDFSLSCSQTTLPMPAFDTRVTGVINSPSLPLDVTIIPIFYRVATNGFDVAGTLGDVGIHFEFAQRNALDPINSIIPQQTNLSSLGFDFSVPLGKSEIYLNAVFLAKDTIGGASVQTGFEIPNFEPFDRNLFFVAEDRITSKFHVGVHGIVSFLQEDSWISPSASYSFGDNVALEGGMDFFTGSEKGAYGQYRENNRVRTLLTLQF